MNKVIVTKNQNGTCKITIPTDAMFDVNSRDRLELAEKGILVNASYDEVLEWIRQKDAPDGRITDIANLPVDRTFRNAWTDDNPTETVDVDMNKARNIQMDKLRDLRSPKLSQLDIDFRKRLEPVIKRLIEIAAVSDADIESLNTIISDAQKLRDIPQTFDLSSAVSPDELKNMIPDILK